MNTALESFELRNRALGDLAPHARVIDRILAEQGSDLIPLLQAVQAAFGFLPRDVLEHVARRANIPLSRVYGVASFYAGFFFEPRGRRIVRVCQGTACHVRGAPRITEEVSKFLGIEPGETTKDRAFTLERVVCVGCCSLAPVMVVGSQTFGRLEPRGAVQVIQRLDPEPDA